MWVFKITYVTLDGGFKVIKVNLLPTYLADPQTWQVPSSNVQKAEPHFG